MDSKDPNRLYNIYQPLTLSYDGGKTFDSVPMIPADETKGVHADFHAFWVHPNDPKHFIIGGDGGIGITRDHGKSWYFPESIPVAQFYHINVDNDRPYNVYGGMQDNGNWSGPGYTWKRGGIRTLYWQYLVGGDGFYIEPDLENSRFGYGTSQNGDLYRYDKLTGYYSSIKPHAEQLNTSLRFNWNAAFAKDPFDNNAVYYGSQFVHKSTDKGATWKIISPDLSTNNPIHQKGDYGGLTLDISGAENYNSILSIAPSSVDKQVIWAGTDDGQVQLTKDGGKTWQNLTQHIKGMPHEAWVAQIQASPFDAGAAWLVVNNYRKGDYRPFLFKTMDYGKTWTKVADEKNIKGYALSVVQDFKEPKLVFLGTEHGLWISIDEGNTWVQFKNGFPSVSTMDLTIQESESALIVGTFGRAIWILDDLTTLRTVAKQSFKKEITALTVNDAVQVKGLFINPPGNIWTGFNTTFEGENKVFQKVKIPYFLKEESKVTTKIIAKIYDEQNQFVNMVTADSTSIGLNYLIWKLDEQAFNLPGAWITEDSRGIPVLPGKYKIVLHHETSKDSTYVRVVPDPRFDVAPSIDEQLYGYQKQVDVQVEQLGALLSLIDQKQSALSKLKKQLQEWKVDSTTALLPAIKNMQTKLKTLKSQGQTARPQRQLGAWQTSEVTPYSKVKAVQKIAMSRTRPISQQERQLLAEASQLVQTFQAKTNQFMTNEWNLFVQQVKEADINWWSNL